MYRIDWQHDRRQPLVRVLIFPPSTTMTISGVSRAIARELALVRRGKRPLGSAGGETHPERYLFRVGLQPEPDGGGGLPFVFDDVIGFELFDNGRFDALIGMDVLGACELLLRRDGTARLAFR